MNAQFRSQLSLLARYGLVGTFNAVIGYGIFLITITVFRLDTLVGYGLTVLVWTGLGYRLQRLWVFKTKPSRSASLKYFVSQFVLWGLGIFGMFLCIQILGMSPAVSYWLNFLVWSVAMFVYSRFGIFSLSVKKSRTL